MQQWFYLIMKIVRRGFRFFQRLFDSILTYFVFYTQGIKFSTFTSTGYPFVSIALGGKCEIGADFKINNRRSANPIGRTEKCSLVVQGKGALKIGDRVGMSSVAIVCANAITIGHDVKIGGNVVIYDTDFHSLASSDRHEAEKDKKNTATAPVSIGNNVFIGAHTTILKGVTIGDNSIIGACSVVTKNIPENQIWAGNPALFIRNIK